MKRQWLLIPLCLSLFPLITAACERVGPGPSRAPAAEAAVSDRPVPPPELPSDTPETPMEPSAAPSDTPAPEAVSLPSGFLDGDDFPSEKEITVVREGVTESYTASLRISDLGYAVYVLPGFVFVPADEPDVDYDAIFLANGSDFALRIRSVTDDRPQSEDGPDEGVYRAFQRVQLGGFLLEAELRYPAESWPSEALEGAGALLGAMWETVTRGG
jgi:hypothetical protein